MSNSKKSVLCGLAICFIGIGMLTTASKAVSLIRENRSHSVNYIFDTAPDACVNFQKKNAYEASSVGMDQDKQWGILINKDRDKVMVELSIHGKNAMGMMVSNDVECDIDIVDGNYVLKKMETIR